MRTDGEDFCGQAAMGGATGDSPIMVMYKAPTFAERAASAAEARQKALEKLKARPPIDESVLEARKQAAAAREAAAQAKREAKKQEIADKLAAEALAASAAVMSAEESEAAAKAERDRRYAERKKNKKRK